MLAQNGRLKIALQRDGRITEDSLSLLRAAGLDFAMRSRSLFAPCRNYPLDILSVRDDDIPEYVQDGVSDLGIVGQNIVAEKKAEVATVERLGFGNCRLVICVPKEKEYHGLPSLAGKRIATSYPHTVKQFLERENIKAEIIEISGSVEIAPALDVADATCDIMSTGSTARMNGLVALHTVFASEAVLIGNLQSVGSPEKRSAIETLVGRMRSVLHARGKKYIMMNAPAPAVAEIKKLVPGMSSPTVVPLADPSMVAIHSVISEDMFWIIAEQLKQAGASDIIVVPIEKMIA